MDIYHYSPDTGEYTGTSVARIDPLDTSRHLIPASATTIAPPDPVLGFARVFNGTEWQLNFINVDGEVTNSPSPTIEDVKLEANRRCIAVADENRQRNLTDRRVEFALKLASGEALTDAEQAERAEGQIVWDRIKGIRMASNNIEQMNPIPADYATNDTYWGGV